MRHILAAVIVSLLLTGAGSAAWGHGTEGETQTAEGILVIAEYDDGEPMSYAAVEITGPGSDILFQKGRADRNGAFMFLPDRSGRWEIVIQDQLGHRLVLERQVADARSASPSAGKEAGEVLSPPVSRVEGIIAGIGIICGLSGIAYGLKSRPR